MKIFYPTACLLIPLIGCASNPRARLDDKHSFDLIKVGMSKSMSA